MPAELLISFVCTDIVVAGGPNTRRGRCIQATDEGDPSSGSGAAVARGSALPAGAALV